MAVEPMDSIAADLARFRRVLLISFPLLLLVAGLGGFASGHAQPGPVWAGWPSRPVRSRAAALTAAWKSGLRPKSCTVLADSFNELLSRLDQSFETMRRFVADASHELRTPLSVIRGEADVALAKERGSGRVQRVAGDHPG